MDLLCLYFFCLLIASNIHMIAYIRVCYKIIVGPRVFYMNKRKIISQHIVKEIVKEYIYRNIEI